MTSNSPVPRLREARVSKNDSACHPCVTGAAVLPGRTITRAPSGPIGTYYPPDLILAGRAGRYFGLYARLGPISQDLLLKDRCPLPDQTSFGLTFPWARFVLAMRDRDRANKNEVAISVFCVATKDLSH